MEFFIGREYVTRGGRTAVYQGRTIDTFDSPSRALAAFQYPHHFHVQLQTGGEYSAMVSGEGRFIGPDREHPDDIVGEQMANPGPIGRKGRMGPAGDETAHDFIRRLQIAEEEAREALDASREEVAKLKVDLANKSTLDGASEAYRSHLDTTKQVGIYTHTKGAAGMRNVLVMAVAFDGYTDLGMTFAKVLELFTSDVEKARKAKPSETPA